MVKQKYWAAIVNQLLFITNRYIFKKDRQLVVCQKITISNNHLAR